MISCSTGTLTTVDSSSRLIFGGSSRKRRSMGVSISRSSGGTMVVVVDSTYS